MQPPCRWLGCLNAGFDRVYSNLSLRVVEERAEGPEGPSRVVSRSDDQDGAQIVLFRVIAEELSLIQSAGNGGPNDFYVFRRHAETRQLVDGNFVKIRVALFGRRPASLPVVGGQKDFWGAVL